MKPAEDGTGDGHLLLNIGLHRAVSGSRQSGIKAEGVRHSRIVGKAANGRPYGFEHSRLSKLDHYGGS